MYAEPGSASKSSAAQRDAALPHRVTGRTTSWLPITHGACEPSVNACVASIAARISGADQFDWTSSKLNTCGSSPDARYGARVSTESAQTSPTAARAPGKADVG